MILKKWSNKQKVEMWVRDSKGRPSRMVYGARRKIEHIYVQPDYIIQTVRMSVEEIKRRYW